MPSFMFLKDDEFKKLQYIRDILLLPINDALLDGHNKHQKFENLKSCLRLLQKTNIPRSSWFSILGGPLYGEARIRPKLTKREQKRANLVDKSVKVKLNRRQTDRVIEYQMSEHFSNELSTLERCLVSEKSYTYENYINETEDYGLDDTSPFLSSLKAFNIRQATIISDIEDKIKAFSKAKEIWEWTIDYRKCEPIIIVREKQDYTITYQEGGLHSDTFTRLILYRMSPHTTYESSPTNH